MSFYLFFLCGILGGVLGGMGMGGGTVLIPLLTIFCGVDQAAAQGINLISFLPMSVFALSIHAKNGLLRKDALFPLIIPAVLCSVPASFLAALLSSELLHRAFGAFLVLLSVYQFSVAIKSLREEKKQSGKKSSDSD